jgi:DNA-binding CsgD family transcriptional regulator
VARSPLEDTHSLVAALTEKEREVLRLVARHLTSKEIGPRLGIAPDSVDARAKRAMRKLGFTDRGKAAALLAEHEATSQQQVYLPPDVGAAADPGNLGEPVEQMVREERTPFPTISLPTVGSLEPASLEEVTTNRFGPWTRLAIIAVIAIGSIIALGAAVDAMKGLIDIAVSRRHLL